MNDRKIFEQYQVLQGRLFTLEDKKQERFRQALILKRENIKTGREIAEIKNKIRALFGKRPLKSYDEIKKEVNDD